MQLYELMKRLSDLLLSVIVLIVLSPFLILLMIIIRISGQGPVIYSQDRIGKDGKPFVIYKFRSMVFDAEATQPLLSSHKEERVTRIGRILRKYRIDEIPNFINVLRGEMSVVGPRPERAYFISQIVPRAPEYADIQKVKPGITSWGQVKFGYASSVDEMIERLKYDLYYMKHRSVWFDIKILFLTIGTVLKGKGK